MLDAHRTSTENWHIRLLTEEDCGDCNLPCSYGGKACQYSAQSVQKAVIRWKVGTHMDVLSGGSRLETPAGGMQTFMSLPWLCDSPS